MRTPLINRRYLAILLFILAYSSSLFAVPPTFTANHTAAELAAAIQGPGLTITNPVLTRGQLNQNAIFSSGNQAGLTIDNGILLTCMNVNNAFTTNSTGSQSDNMGGTASGSDPDLLAIDANANFDTIVFEFDVTLDPNTRILLVNYQFASEEYNEYVGSRFNDAFGFFVSGGDLNQTYNIARVANPNIFIDVNTLANFPPVTVNNVNNGTLGAFDDGTPEDLNNSAYFIDNTGGGVEVEFDGLTVGLNATLDNLTPGETYHFKMALADVGDAAWDTGVFVNSINGIRTPDICYDYKYKQNDRYFTEDYDVTKGPSLVGDVFKDDPIEITLSIQNQEESEVVATNVKMNIRDINTSQVTYIPNSVYVTDAGSLLALNVLDGTNGMTATPSSISNIPIGNFGSQEFLYLSYSVDPSRETLDTPIDANISYTLNLPLSPTQSVELNVSKAIDKDTPICGGANFNYNPQWDIFNIEDPSLSGTGKYNLFTQVVHRPFSFDLVSYSPADFETLQTTTAFVAIEIIDAKGFQNVGSACTEPKAAISPRIWTQIIDDNKVSVDVSQAINDQLISSLDEFYGSAAESAAFRVSFLLDENGTNPIQFTDLGLGKYKMTGFPDLTGRECSIDPRTGNPKLVKKPTNTQLTDQANVACGNAGTVGVDAQVLRNCLECLYSSNVAYVCSRDNFSMRPEAFNVDIFDNQQSSDNLAPKNPVPFTANLAAGYDYRYDINATSHTSTNAVPGYTRVYNTPSVDHNITYYWRGVSTCNDTNDKNPYIGLKNGLAVNNQNRSNNVGVYELQMRDSKWTAVDQAPDHHTGNPSHFNLDDCTRNQSFVPALLTPLNNTNIGCTVSSKHTNVDEASHIYNDYDVTVRPYRFNVSNMIFAKGFLPEVPIDDTNAYIYMNSIDTNTDDLDMSARYTGLLRVEGADGNLTSNFVSGCYAQNLYLDVLSDLLPAQPTFNYRLRERNITGPTEPQTGLFGVINDQIRGTDSGTGTLVTQIVFPTNRMLPSMGAISNLELHLNFDRNTTTAFNPISLNINDLNTTCVTPANCQSMANLSSTYTPYGTVNKGQNVTFLYGRQHTPRQRVAGTTATVPLAYEFYCDSATGCNIGNYNVLPSVANPISPNALLSSDDIRWYIQTQHNTTLDGNVTFSRTRGGIDDVRFGNGANITLSADRTTATYTYDSSRGYPYKVTMETWTQDWLIYNQYDNNPTINNGGNVVNNFELEFFDTGNWGGTDRTDGSNSSTNMSPTTNRRIQW